ncbi:MAG: hypothetical protein HFG49_02185 [Lachnospiraceae bacterium]|jgi:YbbR domain-containing protein|nr:hypothetical protein [Lachnospiraceae bacterium]
MKEILTRNLGLKILSVVIAFFVWLAVVNVSDPQVTDRKEIVLDVVNGDVMTKAGLFYEIEGKRNTVTISYQIRTQDRMNVTSSDFRAYIDLADYYPATGTVPVYVEVLNNKDYLVDSVAARPAVVRIKTEQIQIKDFDLKVNPSGFEADGYEVERYELSEDVVTVEGPESVIGRINSVGIEIDIQGLRTEITGTAVPIFYDANNNHLPLDDRITINVPEITYTIKVLKSRRIPLEFEVGGQPAEGYRYVGLQATSNEVSVVGPDQIVSAIESIRIPSSALNLDRTEGDKLITINVEDYLPDKENMSIPWNSQVSVTLLVRQLSQKEIEVPTNRIIREGESDLNYYEYNQDSIEVVVEGLSEDLELLDVSDLVLEMDVSGMAPGSHRGSLTFEGLPDIFRVVRYSDFQVIVMSKEGGPGMTAAEGGTESSSQEGENESEAREAAGTSVEASLESSSEGESFSLPQEETEGIRESSQEAVQ